MNLERVWEKHRQFLTQVAGGFAVFMLLFFFANGMLSSARSDGQKAIKNNQRLRNEVEEEMLDYSQEVNNRVALRTQLDELLGRVGIRDNLRRSIPSHDAGPIEFNRIKKDIYNSVKKRADQRSMDLPKSDEIRFDVDDVTEQEWNDRCIQLEIIERVLNAAVDYRVSAVEAVEPLDPVQESIRDNEKRVLLRLPVEVRMRVAYSDLIAFLESFQDDKKFIALEIVSLVPAPNGGELTATIRAVGIDIGEAREEVRRPRRSPRSGLER